MTNKTIILIAFLMGFITSTGFAQRSSQATMRVSVRVMSGNSVEVVQPSMIQLSENSLTDLGAVKIKGAENTVISVDGNVTLKGPDGKEVTLNVSHKQFSADTSASSVNFEGKSKQKMMAGIYRGKLTTTVEYF
ncbi:MAG: hypothetical protein PVI44_14480 [Balneolaceae bacterium]|jgi:hypothetical protein